MRKQQQILRKELLRLEEIVKTRFNNIEDRLEHAPAFFELFHSALENYGQQMMGRQRTGNNERDAALKRAWSDDDLQHAHQKIVHYLADQYDYRLQVFKPVHFSKLVREARVGKNLAKGYLTLLEKRGYIVRREDGNRVYYGLAGTSN